MRHKRMVPVLAMAIGLAACSGGHGGDNAADNVIVSNEIGAVDDTLSVNEALPADNDVAAAENALDAGSAGANTVDPLGNGGEATTNAL